MARGPAGYVMHGFNAALAVLLLLSCRLTPISKLLADPNTRPAAAKVRHRQLAQLVRGIKSYSRADGLDLHFSTRFILRSPFVILRFPPLQHPQLTHSFNMNTPKSVAYGWAVSTTSTCATTKHTNVTACGRLVLVSCPGMSMSQVTTHITPPMRPTARYRRD